MESFASFTENARAVLRARYLRRDDAGNPIETPEQLVERVAGAIAEGERAYGATQAEVDRVEERFHGLLGHRAFVPNTPTLINAGRQHGQLAACFVLPVADSLDGIFHTAKMAALIQKTGGGTGYDLSQLRPRGDRVGDLPGAAGGPVSFLGLFDATSEAIRQGGVRRGASMGVLSVHHPDVLDFVAVKAKPGMLTAFNLSVLASKEFLDAVRDGRDYALRNPRTGQEVRRLDARRVYDAIARHAWGSGEPGMLFEERIERDNPTPHLGRLSATNPCGEQPLLPYEACTLGSINLSRFVRDGALDVDGLADTARAGVRFLDDVLTVNGWPSPEVAEAARRTRKIGLGVMGFADLLVALGVPYDDPKAVDAAHLVMATIARAAKAESEQLARERGPFPEFEGSAAQARGDAPRRNATFLAVAPTGTISVIAGCSAGIEPLYGVVFTRHVLDGQKLREVNGAFLDALAKEGVTADDGLLEEIAEEGLAHVARVPEKLRRLFRSAHELAPEVHVRMQAAFQRHVDSAVSKTVNLPHAARFEEVREVFRLAEELGCKGITVYRDGSREGQVLRAHASEAAHEKCPECGAELKHGARCTQCVRCGWGRCG